MTAYNPDSLKNLFVSEQAEEAYLAECIDDETYKKIILSHPVNFYSPNTFVQIGLGILTVFISMASLGILYMIAKPHNFYYLFFVFGLLSFAGLEVLINSNKHYNSGVDNVLLWSASGFTVIGLSGVVDNTLNNELVLSIISLLICTVAALRYSDRIMGIAAFISLYVFLFYFNKSYLPMAAFSFPFILISLSFLCWLLFKKLNENKSNFIYQNLCSVLSITAILAFYFSGNFFLVSELSKEHFQLELSEANKIYKAIFWIWTMAIPILYIWKGIKEKDLIFTRGGILLFAVSVLTFRYYHSILPAEIALITAGVLLMISSYWLMDFLQTPKIGFRFKQSGREGNLANLEALVIGEAFGHSQVQPTADPTQFGGGDFGGGGAGDKY